MKQNSNRQPQRRQSASNRRTATERQRRQNTAQAKRAAAQRRKASAQRRKTSGRRRTQSSMRQRRTITIIAAVALALIAIILLVIGLRSCGSLDKKTDTAKEDTAVVQQDGRVTGKPAKATILSSGDYLIHKMILDSVRTGNGYDFDSIFTNVKDEITAADYAVCNFEFTITETGNFSFYPHFKLPPETADALKNAGFDFLVTANNHSGDDREDGIYRTVKILRQKGFKTTGTFETPDEKKYSVVDVNGIKVGIVNYTFGTIDDQGLKALNGNYALDANASQCINVFQNEKLPRTGATSSSCSRPRHSRRSRRSSVTSAITPSSAAIPTSSSPRPSSQAATATRRSASTPPATWSRTSAAST